MEISKDKYVKGYSTEAIMYQFSNGEERGYVATVALLYVSKEVLEEIIPSKEKLCHVLACRSDILDLLKTEGVVLHGKAA